MSVWKETKQISSPQEFFYKKHEKRSDTEMRHQEEEERTLKIRQRDEKG